MKKRFGFVSNSSSSSFILSVPKERINENISIPIDISNCIEHKLTTKEELDKWFHENWICFESESIEEFLEDETFDYNYPAMVNAIENGKVVLIGSGSSESDNPADIAIYYGAINTINDPDIEVISNED